MHCRVAVFLSFLSLQGCVTSGERIDRIAHDAGLTRTQVAGIGYEHVVYRNAAVTPGDRARRLVVFLDGDGRPWTADGLSPSDDPTTRKPLALQLLARTGTPALYVSRPCYQQIVSERCSAAVWTSDRYSPQVVASIAAAIGNATRPSDEIVVVGYSGGGVLAVLVAERLQHVVSVVTLAANLDTDAWTQHHGYLPLTGSLNPARSEQAHPWPEVHLQGVRDTVVPVATTAGYFERFPRATHRQYDDYDHACCWVEHWPSLVTAILESGTDVAQ